MTTGVFQYIDPATLSAGAKPWAKVDVDATSFARTPRRLGVTDLRSARPEDFTTDTAGFSLHRSPSSVPAASLLADEQAIRGAYYPEVEALLRAHLPSGGSIARTLLFDHTIRVHAPTAARQPVQQVHVDQTPGAAAARVRRHVPDEAEAAALLGRRYQIVNVWRPIGHAASDFPLAVVDWRSIDEADLVPVELLYPVRAEGDDGDDRGKEVLPEAEGRDKTDGYEVKGETYAVAPNDKHRLYYVKDMTPDEVLFIKCFDSWSQGRPEGKEGIAALTPHTAFVDPDTPPDAKGRQSIEVRCLVFYE